MFVSRIYYKNIIVLCVPVFLPGHHATETQRVIFCIPVIVGAGESVILPLVGFSVF